MIPPVQQMRDPEMTLGCLRDFLILFRPNAARWWSYSVSHRWFELRLSVSETEYVMIAMFGTSFLTGPTGWNSPNLAFELRPHGDVVGGATWIINDRESGFRAKADSLYWGFFPGTELFSGWFGRDREDFAFRDEQRENGEAR